MSLPPSWELTRFGDIAKVTHGWPFLSAEYDEPRPGLPIVLSIGNFDYDGGFRFGSSSLKGYSGDYPPEYELVSGDLMLVMTCQTSGGEILGVPGLIPSDGRRGGQVIAYSGNEGELWFTRGLQRETLQADGGSAAAARRPCGAVRAGWRRGGRS